jgi:hypothetical protein
MRKKGQSKAQLMRKAKDEENLVPYRTPTPERLKERARLEADSEAWLLYYFPELFCLPFSELHRELIQSSLDAMVHGTSITVAATRGFGKSAILWAMALKGALTGMAQFPLVVGWKKGAGDEFVDQWINALAENRRLREDYPCVCDCFAESNQSKRLQNLLRRVDDEDRRNNDRAGCDVRRIRGQIILPDTREDVSKGGRELPQAALAGASINGSIKGMHVGLMNGGTLRPDVVFLDDPQDDAAAESPTVVQKTIRRIDFTIRSLSGPQRRLTVMAAVTCVNDFDVSTHLLTRPGTRGIRIGQVAQWPKDWNAKKSKSRAAWDKWNDARLEGLGENDGGDAARDYYTKHKKTLAKGFKVTWPDRYHTGDDNRPGDPDALFTTMWEFYDLGEAAFMSERQNRPIKEESTVYELTADIIKSQIHSGRKRFYLPDQAKLLIVSTDLNHYGLHSCAVGYANNQTAWMAWYDCYNPGGHGIIPKNCPEREAKQRMFEALTAHGEEIAGLPFMRDKDSMGVGSWVIDAGYMPDVVRLYVEGPGRKVGMPVMPARGYPHSKYKPTGKNVVGKPGEQMHLTDTNITGRFLAFNACYWREVQQKAWLPTPNAPGSISLYEGRHLEIATQISREKLMEKFRGQHGTLWNWHTAPGKHDYCDSATMCYVGAAWHGIGTWERSRRAPRRKRTRVKHIQI